MPLLPFIPTMPMYSSEALDPPILDKVTGLPLANGQVFFYQDLNRIVPQPVYEISGSPPNYTFTELPNPMFLSAKGTFVDNSGADIAVYYYPWDDFGNSSPYYIQVFNSQNVPQFVRQNWPPIPGNGENPGEAGGTSTENIVVNGQFGYVNWDPLIAAANQFVLTVPGIVTNKLYPIMPGWSLLVSSSGAGTVTINQLPIAGTNNYPGQPPYVLEISSSGAIATLGIQQNYYGNPNIFSQDSAGNGGWVTTSLLLAPLSSATVNYVPSSGIGTVTLLNAPQNVSGQYQQVSNTVQLPMGSNPTVGQSAFTAIQILFNPGPTPTIISNVQVIPSFEKPAGVIAYNQVPLSTQAGQLFSYYQPGLNYKPIPSYLTGWDFPFNPAQINGDNVAVFAGANQAQYFWDQTIVYQTLTNGVSGSRAANGGLTLTSAGAGQVALVQYLDQTMARKILSDRASVHMSLSGTIALGPLAGYVTLWATTDANLPTLPNCFITGMGPTGIPTSLSSGNWVQVPNVNQNNWFLTEGANSTNSESADFYLNGWDLAGAVPVNTATYFAIVVGFSAWSNLDTLTFNSISLCAGDIATRPAPKTHDETLRACERWYEKSYQASVVQAAGASNPANPFPVNTTFNALSAPMMACIPASGSPFNTFVLEAPFTIEYRTLKRVPTTQGFPTVTIYSEATGAAANVSESAVVAGSTAVLGDVGIAIWGTTYIGNKFATFLATTNSGKSSPAFNATTPPLFYIRYHYVADARLGVVN